MKRARQYRQDGQPDQAAGTLERALRIEPRNYFVWSALAQAHLAQKNYAQAESMAQKSNALARGNIYVTLENWKTIAAARNGQGDADGAADAAAQIAALQARLDAAQPDTP
nr:tetratricopeptide repeat protein [Solimonas terrae]